MEIEHREVYWPSEDGVEGNGQQYIIGIMLCIYDYDQGWPKSPGGAIQIPLAINDGSTWSLNEGRFLFFVLWQAGCVGVCN